MRSTHSDLYRYGYTGMEKDSTASQDHYSTYFRPYDARIGRWWGVDPVTHPGESPYVAMGDDPVDAVDPSGADTTQTGRKTERKGPIVFPGVIVTASRGDQGYLDMSTYTVNGLQANVRWGGAGGASHAALWQQGHVTTSAWHQYEADQQYNRGTALLHDPFLNTVGDVFQSTKYWAPGVYLGTYGIAGATVGSLELAHDPWKYGIVEPVMGVWTLNKATNPLYATIDPLGALEAQRQIGGGLVNFVADPEGATFDFARGAAHGLLLTALSEGISGIARAATAPVSTGMYMPESPLLQQNVSGVDIPMPDPVAQGPHTTLGSRIGEDGVPYRQSATFPESTWPKARGTVDGERLSQAQDVPLSRVDWSDHSRPWVHEYPHQHIFNYDWGAKVWRFTSPMRFYQYWMNPPTVPVVEPSVPTWGFPVLNGIPKDRR